MEPEREPGECVHCGNDLQRFGDAPGLTPYWACPACPVRKATVLPPRNLGFSTTLVRGRITDPILPGDYSDADVPEPTERFDADAPDPARFVDRVCDRLALVTRTIRRQERQRRIDDQGRDADAVDQTALTGWSE